MVVAGGYGLAAKLTAQRPAKKGIRMTPIRKQFLMRFFLVTTTITLALGISACSKKPAKVEAPTPSARAAAVPRVSFTVVPGSVQLGQSASLAWQTEGADTVSIEPIGGVGLSGSLAVSPSSSTTYHLIATGPGGTSDATARLTVTPAATTAARVTAPVLSNQAEEALFSHNMQDVYFDYDKADIRNDQLAALDADVRFLKQHPGIHFTLEGYCDDRGSTEYNLALGASRSTTTKDALVRAGIDASRIQTTSYGKEKPFCSDSTEECWQQNRRGHFAYQK